jgi:hypothetical protein
MRTKIHNVEEGLGKRVRKSGEDIYGRNEVEGDGEG